MSILITGINRFVAACNALNTADILSPAFHRGLLFCPDGSIVATDGYKFVIAKECFNPFKGKPKFVLLDKGIKPSIAHRAVKIEMIFGLNGAVSIHIATAGKAKDIFITGEALDDFKYPCFSLVIQPLSDTTCTEPIPFNPRLLMPIYDSLVHPREQLANGVTLTQIEKGAPINVSFTCDRHISLTISPLKKGGDD